VSLVTSKDLATRAMIDRHASYLRLLVGRLVRWDPELPDILQDVFVRALRGVDGLRDPAALKPWLSRIAICTVHEWKATRRRRVSCLVGQEDLEVTLAPNGDPVGGFELARADALLAEMPSRERLAFVLRFVEGMSHSEMTEAMRTSRSTVKRTIIRAEKRFVALSRRDPLLAERLITRSRWRRTALVQRGPIATTSFELR
jgi:RNA polymerase sigma-70 factor (ECF subfamily)